MENRRGTNPGQPGTPPAGDARNGQRAADLASAMRDELRTTLAADLATSHQDVATRLGRPAPPGATPPATRAAASPAQADPGGQRFTAPSRCPSCSGSGQSHLGGTCGVCSGSGFIGTY